MIDELKISVAFTGDELYETIKLYDILRDMDFELSETQVQVFEKLTDVELEDEISEYDENLYEILTDYVTDTVGSYTALQEFIHDRHANDWIEN